MFIHRCRYQQFDPESNYFSMIPYQLTEPNSTSQITATANGGVQKARPVIRGFHWVFKSSKSSHCSLARSDRARQSIPVGATHTERGLALRGRRSCTCSGRKSPDATGRECGRGIADASGCGVVKAEMGPPEPRRRAELLVIDRHSQEQLWDECAHRYAFAVERILLREGSPPRKEKLARMIEMPLCCSRLNSRAPIFNSRGHVEDKARQSEPSSSGDACL